ncbi:MAG: DHH family phosphoesterase [Candidatus Woesearchaeota archaeon]
MTGNQTGNLQKQKYASLVEMLEGLEGRTAIELQRTPDPDAMGAAMAIQHICSIVNPELEMDITHYSRLSHPMNILMKKKLDIQMRCYNNGSPSPDDYDNFIFVDHSGKTSQWFSNGRMSYERVVCIVDHHDVNEALPEGMNGNLRHLDRRVVGASCSIITDYFMNGLMDDLKMEDDFTRTAAGLMLGIRSDTKYLIKNSKQLDHKAHSYLSDFIDVKDIDEIENPQWPSRWISIQGRAMVSRETRNGMTVAMADYITPEEHDALAVAADQLLMEECTQTAVVVGIQPEIYDITVRSKSPTLEMSDFLKERFGHIEGARYGGKDGAGGVQIPNAAFSDFCFNGRNKEDHLELTKREIYSMLFEDKE